jgi:mono/diheme cytochrome c family protein
MSPLSIVHRSSGGRSRKAMLETLIRHLDMVRLTLGTLVLAVALSGCVGIIGDDPPDGLSPAQRKARSLFLSKALPVMTEQCAGCHQSLMNADFLKGASPQEIYDGLKNFTPSMISYLDGTKSRLVTKDVHSGPAFATTARTGQIDSDYEVMVEWLRAEQRGGGDTDDGTGTVAGAKYILTSKITPVVCAGPRASCQTNEFTLNTIRPDGTGIDAKITFLFEVLPASNAPYLANLRLVGGPEGAYIESPLFLGYTAGKTAPSIDGDTFFGSKTNTAANMGKTIGSGFAGLTGITALTDGGVANEFAMSFQIIDKYKPEGAVDVSACKQLGSFVTNVLPLMTGNCVNCHGEASGNAGAKGNLLMSAANAATCQQAKTNAPNLNAIPTNPIFVAPKPGATGHGQFKFPDSTAWEAALTTWLTAEKTSP